MFNRLEGCATGPVLLGVASLTGLAIHVEHESHSWNTADDQDDNEGAKRPTPTGAIQEMVRYLGSSECRRNPRSCVDAEDDHTVLEGSDVGAHDIDDIEKTDMAGPVKDVATDVGLNVRADSLDDHTKDTNQEHHAEALDTAPEIDNLRHG